MSLSLYDDDILEGNDVHDNISVSASEIQTDKAAGWASGIKLLQSQLQLKKASVTQPRRDQVRKQAAILAPVIDLKAKKSEDEENNSSGGNTSNYNLSSGKQESKPSRIDPEWNFENEYDPMWPNNYEKVVQELKERREREKEREDDDRRRKYREDRDRRTRERYGEDRRRNGFDQENEEEEDRPPPKKQGGVAIAPPPSLQDSPPRHSGFTGETYTPGLSVAAKIMARYGFKEGQGLGKQEQGMSTALQVEKTSKRGGRIISEKDNMMPPPLGSLLRPSSPVPNVMPPPPAPLGVAKPDEPNITEIMRNPSKVVLLRNMVGPGEVDEELEPETKEECNKYGDVNKVMIYEVADAEEEDAVRIFVEFKRVESAIKAVVDINGRYFGGRLVRAGFYDIAKFSALDLMA